MRNIEKHLPELLEHGIDFAVAKDGSVSNCNELICENCLFNSKETCEYQLFRWLFEETEAEEPKKINLRPTAFDIDEVIAELEANSKVYDSVMYEVRMIDLEDAVEIVKGGVK